MSVAFPRLRSRTVVAVLLALCAAQAHAARLQEARPLMGTVVEITAEGADAQALHTAMNAAYGEMNRLSDMMNRYNPASIVSAINDAAGARAVPVPPEMMAPAWPIRRPGGAVCPQMKPTTGLVR